MLRMLVQRIAAFTVFLTLLATNASALEVAALGLEVATVTPELARTEKLPAASGAVVRSLRPSSPAMIGGITPGDIILALGDVPIGDADDLVALVEHFRGSPSLTLSILRGTSERVVQVVARNTDIEETPEEAEDEFTARGRGASRDAPRSLDQPPNYSVMRVFYGADRNSTGRKTPGEFYGADRGSLVYGSCDVTIPNSHKLGELETSSLIRLELNEDPAKHVILASIKEQSAGDFYNDVRTRFDKNGKKSAFIFVHGYNVSFKDAARRTAQMAHDLKFAGAPVFFSWPSQARYLGYPVDETNVDFARADLREFIKDFARTSGVEEIYVIAHSMGNRALTGALSDLFREAPEIKSQIKEVILAAPDIDSDVFKRDIAPTISGLGQSVTLYASSGDWALKASKKWHGYPRAGDSGDKLVIAPNLVTVDASAVNTDFFGHSYFADSGSIVEDIQALLSGLRLPDERKQLTRVVGGNGVHWRMDAAIGKQ